MGKKVYTINGNLYIIDEDTGKIGTITIEEGKSIPQRDVEELLKVILKEKSKEE